MSHVGESSHPVAVHVTTEGPVSEYPSLHVTVADCPRLVPEGAEEFPFKGSAFPQSTIEVNYLPNLRSWNY